MIVTKIWIFLKLLIVISFSLQAADIIYLKGTCSVGKSTLMRSFANEDIELVDEDAIMHKSYVEAVSKRFPEAFETIQKVIPQENLYHALREKEGSNEALTMIQDELDSDLLWRKKVSQGIDEEVLRRIGRALSRNKTVLLDSWYITPDRLKTEFPETKVIKVLLYRPLSVIYDNFLNRNKEAMRQNNLSEKRYIRQLIGSYTSLYQITPTPLQALHKITRAELDPVFNQMAATLTGDHPYKKSVFTFEEISKGCFLELTEKFLSPFADAEELYLEPKDSYDIILTDPSALHHLHH